MAFSINDLNYEKDSKVYRQCDNHYQTIGGINNKIDIKDSQKGCLFYMYKERR